MTTVAPLVISPSPTGLHIELDGVALPYELSWRWLRDHSDDDASIDPTTRQRRVDTFAIDPARRADATVNSEGLELRWTDAVSTVSLSTLRSLFAPAPANPQSLWHTPDRAEVHARQPTDIDGWLDDVHRLGFGILTGAPTTEEGVDELVQAIAPPRSSIFGAMWTVASDLTEHADTAYSTAGLDPHTDGTYSIDSPGLQLFAFLEREGTGGESVLVDGFAAAEQLRSNAPEHFATLTTIDVPGRYLEPGVDVRASRPAIRLDTTGAVEQVSFNNYDRAPMTLPPDEMAAFYDAYGALHGLVMDPARALEIRLEPGDVLLFDNHRMLHGRRSYTGTRRFRGCYFNREDFLSRRRVSS